MSSDPALDRFLAAARALVHDTPPSDRASKSAEFLHLYPLYRQVPPFLEQALDSSSSSGASSELIDTTSAALEVIFATPPGLEVLPEATHLLMNRVLHAPQPPLRRLGAALLGKALAATTPLVAGRTDDIIDALVSHGLTDPETCVAVASSRGLLAYCQLDPTLHVPRLLANPTLERLVSLKTSRVDESVAQARALEFACACSAQCGAVAYPLLAPLDQLLQHEDDELATVAALEILRDVLAQAPCALDQAAGQHQLAAHMVQTVGSRLADLFLGVHLALLRGKALELLCQLVALLVVSQPSLAQTTWLQLSPGLAALIGSEEEEGEEGGSSIVPRDVQAHAIDALGTLVASLPGASFLLDHDAVLMATVARVALRPGYPDALREPALHTLATWLGAARDVSIPPGITSRQEGCFFSPHLEARLKDVMQSAVAGNLCDAIMAVLRRPSHPLRIGVYRLLSALARHPWAFCLLVSHDELRKRLVDPSSEVGVQTAEWRFVVVTSLLTTSRDLASDAYAGFIDTIADVQAARSVAQQFDQALEAARKAGPHATRPPGTSQQPPRAAPMVDTMRRM